MQQRIRQKQAQFLAGFDAGESTPAPWRAGEMGCRHKKDMVRTADKKLLDQVVTAWSPQSGNATTRVIALGSAYRARQSVASGREWHVFQTGCQLPNGSLHFAAFLHGAPWPPHGQQRHTACARARQCPPRFTLPARGRAIG